MKVILIEENAFYELLEQAVARLESKLIAKQKNWLTPEEAMKVLGIKSTTTLQRYRDEGKIRFSQPSPRIILYDPKSIEEFLESKSHNPF